MRRVVISDGALSRERPVVPARQTWRIIELIQALVMRNKSNLANSVARRTPPLLCLFALLLFEAPFIGAAVIASGACCTGDHCPIAAHHHSPAKAEETKMDCGQHMNGDLSNAGRLQACSVSCCQTTEKAAVHAQVFLLTPLAWFASFSPIPETLSALRYTGDAESFSPLSPPPKSRPRLI
jgi:hypothetical protein